MLPFLKFLKKQHPQIKLKIKPITFYPITIVQNHTVTRNLKNLYHGYCVIGFITVKQ